MLALAIGPRVAEAQKALVYCPVSIDATGCSTIKNALTAAYPSGVDAGYDGTQGTVDLKSVDLFQYHVVLVPSLADDSVSAPYALLRDPAVASKLKAALLGRRAFWSGTPDQGVLSTTRPQKDALIQNLAAWAASDFATVNAPGLVVLQDNSDDVTRRYDWVQAITGFALTADTRLASYSAVSSLTAAGNAVLSSNGTTLAYANMASMGFQTPSGAPGTSMDAVGQTGTSVGGQIVLVTQSGANVGGAVVKTDQDDYAPGTPVVITGSGFGAGETVTLLLHEDPTIEPDFSFTTTADASGAFVFNGFKPDTLDVDVRFILKATGQSSGRVAQTTFTDAAGDVTVKMATSGATFSLTWSLYNNATCSGSATSSGSVTVGSTGGTGFSKSVPNPGAIKLQAGAASNGGTFASWGFSSGPLAPSSSSNPVCVPRDNNAVNILANYQTTAATSLSVAAASGTYGGTTSLSATLTSGSPAAGVNGKTVTFSLNGSAVCGATGLPTCPTTNVSGLATLAGVSLSGINVANYATGVAASFAGDAAYLTSSGTAALTVTQASQTIAFGAITTKTFGDPDILLTATATSGLPVSYAATGNCTVTGNTASLTGAGSCTITASQSGNTNYAAAPQVQQTFTIDKATATLAIDPTSLSATYDGSAHSAVVTTTPAGLATVAVTYAGSATVPTGAGSYAVVAKLTNVNYTATDATGTLVIGRATPTFSNLTASAVTYKATSATIAGTLKAGTQPATGSVSVTVAGTGGSLTGSATLDGAGAFSATIDPSTLPANPAGYDVSISVPQSANFEAATDNSLKLVVNKATQSITFGALAGKTFGDAPFTVSATASSGLGVTFSASGPCTVSASTVTITGAGSCTITAAQAGDQNFDAAPSVPQSFAVAKATATITVNGYSGTYDGAAHGATGTAKGVGGADLSASLDLGAKFTNVPGGMANWSFTGGTDYNDASGTAAITITRATGSIGITGPATITYGQSGSLSTTKVGDGSVSYAATAGGGTVCTVDPGTGAVTMLSGTGDCKVTAALTAGTNYTGATSNELTIAAAKAAATINVTGYTGVYDGQPHGATGTATGLANANLSALLNFGASYTDVPGGVANWTFPGDANYLSASGSVQITITKANQTTAVVLTAPSTMTYGQPAVTLTASGGNGTGAYAFNIGASSGCSLAGDKLSVVNASASCAVTALRLGDNNHFDSPSTAASTVALVKATANVVVSGYTGTYDGVAHGATGTATGVLGEDLASQLSLGATYTNYPGGTASWSFAGGNNYNSTSGSASIVINQRAASVTPQAATKVYGQSDPTLTGTLTGFVASDNVTATYSRTPGETVLGGPYTISAQLAPAAALGNYVVTSNTASFTITPRAITLTPQAADLIWTGSPLTPSYSLAVTAGSLASGEALSVFGTPTFSPASVTAVGSYPITVTGLSNSNYTLTIGAGSVKVIDTTSPIGSITSLNPVPLNTAPTLAVNFNDVNTGNSNIVAWRYSLDNVDQGVINVSGGPNASFTKTLAPLSNTDVVSVCVQGEDAGGNWSISTCALLAVYDPSAGFVTGGGWIMSPAGAYVQDLTLTGKANFGFVSKYQKGANTPTGNTEFQFREGNLNFKSVNFQWLVIQGTTMAQFKGTGTINGAGSYNFMVTAIDGDNFTTRKSDAFRIKITDASTGALVYDNQNGASDTSAAATDIGGGSIQIQSK